MPQSNFERLVFFCHYSMNLDACSKWYEYRIERGSSDFWNSWSKWDGLTELSPCLYADEKERFDPSQFQESIVQGLNQTGTDLEAVAKFLDASGAKLDYRRYAEILFDILVAGGMLGKRHSLNLFTLPSCKI